MSAKKALNVAVAYLTKQARTEAQVAKHLAKREFDQPVIDETLNKLKHYGYIDDQNYAQQFVAEKSGKLSGRMIKNKLRHRGIDRLTLDEAQIDMESDFPAALAFAKKAMKTISDPQKARQKLTQRLLYRGFDYDTINKVWSVLHEPEND